MLVLLLQKNTTFSRTFIQEEGNWVYFVVLVSFTPFFFWRVGGGFIVMRKKWWEINAVLLPGSTVKGFVALMAGSQSLQGELRFGELFTVLRLLRLPVHLFLPLSLQCFCTTHLGEMILGALPGSFQLSFLFSLELCSTSLLLESWFPVLSALFPCVKFRTPYIVMHI